MDKLRQNTIKHMKQCDAGYEKIVSKDSKNIFVVCCGCGKCVQVLDNTESLSYVFKVFYQKVTSFIEKCIGVIK